MKLKIKKDEQDVILIKVNEKDFSVENYIDMVKEIKGGGVIELEFEGNITEDEKCSLEEMVVSINKIKEIQDNK